MPIIIHPISPVAIDLFGLQIRWYAIAYIAAFIIGYWLIKKLAQSNTPIQDFLTRKTSAQENLVCHSRAGGNRPTGGQEKKFWDDLLAAVILGVIIGGRMGYVLFYNLPFFIAHPLEIFMVWHGGMSFHGGLLGVIVAVFLFAKRTKIQKQSLELRVKSSDKKQNAPTIRHRVQNAFSILDPMAVVAPIGLFFGRIANFINMEVMGRATDGPLGVVFVDTDGTPIGDAVARYPSPLLEAGLEGVLLFLIMFALWRWTRMGKRAGALSGAFAMFYAVFRIIAELFRQPDVQLGFLTGWGLTMGQLLSGIMFIAGAVVLAMAYRKRG
ncbi:MAG: prolipoprotein diacylglyceryl transferase [Proteobacteria bacterium]|nr:prolipoprotein diacylglyceryl transferase [Pseudomonadota bacterium]